MMYTFVPVWALKDYICTIEIGLIFLPADLVLTEWNDEHVHFRLI